MIFRKRFRFVKQKTQLLTERILALFERRAKALMPRKAQRLHEPAVLLHCECSGFAFLPGPLEAAGRQTLVEEKKAVALPAQCLDLVAFPTAEKEQAVLGGIQCKLPFDQSGQSVDPKPKIRVAAGDIYPVRPSEVVQHDRNARSTASSVAVSAPL